MDSGRKQNFQLTLKACLNNMYAMYRISRACYFMALEGADKDAVISHRDDCVSKLSEAAPHLVHVANRGYVRKETEEGAADKDAADDKIQHDDKTLDLDPPKHHVSISQMNVIPLGRSPTEKGREPQKHQNICKTGFRYEYY